MVVFSRRQTAPVWHFPINSYNFSIKFTEFNDFVLNNYHLCLCYTVLYVFFDWASSKINFQSQASADTYCSTYQDNCVEHVKEPYQSAVQSTVRKFEYPEFYRF